MDDGLKKKRKPNSGSFQKGQPSANRKGRPRKADKPKTAAAAALDQPVYVMLDGKRTKLTAEEAAAYNQAALAVKGDKGAFKMLLQARKAEQEAQARQTEFEANYPLDEHDLKTIVSICRRIRSVPPASDA